MFFRLGVFVAASLFLNAADDAERKQLAYTRAYYSKYEFRIPMRDGVRLFATVYVPKDASEKYPILMQRTPYSVAPYGVDNYRARLGPSEAAEKEAFIFVYEDVRGRYLSEGTFVDVRPHKTKLDGPRDVDDSTDTYDTVDWLIKNAPNNNGKVGIWGISYPGHYAAHSLIDSHPALKAVSPQAPMGDLADGDDAYHNGAFYLAANFQFYTFFEPRKQDLERRSPKPLYDPGTDDAYNFFLQAGPLSEVKKKYLKDANPYWDDQVSHFAYDDFWRGRSLTPYMKNVKPAVLFVGGWFDAEDLSGPLKLYRALEKNGPSAPNTLVMGPWSHGGWARGAGETLGNLSFDMKTSEYFAENIELPFFVQHLKDKHDKKVPEIADSKAIVFETGMNEWHRFDHWPPKQAVARSLFLDGEGKLTWSAPAASGFDEYLSDPSRPVPVSGEVTDGFGMPGDYMTYDQRFASARPDVLTYVTEPLERNVVIAGPVTPSLRVSTSGTDSDFVVKLIDVYPDDYPNPDPNPRRVHMGGYQQMVRGEPFRGKFRNGFSKPEAFTPGKPEKIEYGMPDVFHTFKTGHRIMVQIQSSWFPLTDRNPQQFLEIPKAKASDFKKATERVYRGGADGSQIRLLVVEGGF
ncbi:MAG: CocE/NonD family hydrolase [Acidobacteriia bacterium]|nr:CocE/NonD family hydrolase [Terriglobia bacterium]